ncbi:hypothetical protein ACMFMF_005572 [Clarireedia jacksonii]
MNTGTCKASRGHPLTYYPLSAVSAPPRIQASSVPLSEPQLAFHPERHYLLLALHRENLRTNSLARRIPALETTLATATHQKIRRNAKKQLSWICSRLNESTRQEGIILSRLGQLSLEEATHRYWAQVEHERRLSQQMINYQASLYEQQLRIMTWNLQNTERSPTTPEVQPAEYPFLRQDTPLHGDAPVWLPVNFEFSRRESCGSGWEELSPLEEEDESGWGWRSGVETTALTTPEARKSPVMGEAASESDVTLDWLGTDGKGKMDVEGWLKERRVRSLPVVGSKWVEVKGEGRYNERIGDE